MPTDTQAKETPAVRCDEWLWRVKLEWKLADMWVGIFWKTSNDVIPQGAPTYALPVYDRLDVWVCLIPCVPIHATVCHLPKTERHNDQAHLRVGEGKL